MEKRIFVEKKSDFNIEATTLLNELKHALHLSDLKEVRIIQIYDVFNIDEVLMQKAIKTVFTEMVTDILLDENNVMLALDEYKHICVEAIPGQFDQRADSAEAALFLLSGNNDIIVKSAQLYLFNKEITEVDLANLEKFILNPVDSRKKDLTKQLMNEKKIEQFRKIPTLTFFNTATEEDFHDYKKEQGLAMEVADLLHIQKYFLSKKRNPTETELKVLDTYWSDHCRHTTFETEIKNISFEESQFQKQLQKAYDAYCEMRKHLGRDEKPETLMDMATIFGRYQRQNGLLDDLEVSDEINACSVEIEVDVDGKKEPWLLMFKNETHNHPTEIEPFGGASTCLGGAIRDPLSGRSYVYQAMRITGAGNILEDLSFTLPGKLPQQLISKGAAKGYSSYGNQIGLATTYVKEYFHPGFVAKRMEVGVVVGAAPKNMVVRAEPQPTDAIILLGGKTGRDGIGGATGSSKVQTSTTIETAGSEVQKGNAIEERKIQRLFRNPDVTKIIKKSNDFGAGGVSVAIGELADGVHINLDLVPLKYQGLNGTEIAISESQERMAVVVAAHDVDTFIKYAENENILAVQVAEVTELKHLVIEWKNEVIVDIERSFLDTNGQRIEVDATVVDSSAKNPFSYKASDKPVLDILQDNLKQMNHASQKGLQTLFDSSIGRSTVLQPIGGKHQITPTETSVQKLPVKSGFTNTVSVLAHGYNPFIAEWSPYHGAAYAVIEATSRIVATGAPWEKARFSYQEYFERMDKNPQKFGKPVSALLGALDAQMQLGLPSIGGKDSMSGSYEELHVPPSLLAFGVTTTTSDKIISPEFKSAQQYIYYLPTPQDNVTDIPFEVIKQNFKTFEAIHKDYKITAASAIKDNGLLGSIALMMFGNQIGAQLQKITQEEAFRPQYGGFVFTTTEQLPKTYACKQIGATIPEFKLMIEESETTGAHLQACFEQTFESIYPTKFMWETKDKLDIQPIKSEQTITNTDMPTKTPKVYIPVFPGTNCEYDTAKAFEKAGAIAHVVPFKTYTADLIEVSIEEMIQSLDEAQIFMLSGGFSAADEPDGSGKFIVNILLNERVKKAIERFIKRGGLILGICNGFQALVKSGLLPYGRFDVVNETSPTLFRNDANQHVAKMVETKIINKNSPWLNNVEIGDTHTIPVSHGEGKFWVTDEELEQLIAKGQIVTQYVDFSGKPTMDTSYNPNGSIAAIEGIISENGQIFGKMGHSERYETGLFQNIPGAKDQKLFESAVTYFAKK